MKRIFLISALCLSAQLFGAANAADLRSIIKVSTAAGSSIQHQLEFDRISAYKVIACLVADANKPLEKGTAAQVLADLRLLNLDIGSYGAKQDQFANIKQAVKSNAKWTVIFVVTRTSGEDYNHNYLYMRILNETTSHSGKLKKSLYCKLNSTGKPTVRLEESGMAEEIWKDASGLAPDELGFEVDIMAIKREIKERYVGLCSICSIQ